MNPLLPEFLMKNLRLFHSVDAGLVTEIRFDLPIRNSGEPINRNPIQHQLPGQTTPTVNWEG